MSSSTKRLADAVSARRKQLGLTHDDVKAAGGPSDTTMGKIERDEAGRVAQVTLRRLDTALQWEPGSAAQVLAGGDPTPVEVVPSGLEAFTAAQPATELARRLTQEELMGNAEHPAAIGQGTTGTSGRAETPAAVQGHERVKRGTQH